MRMAVKKVFADKRRNTCLSCDEAIVKGLEP